MRKFLTCRSSFFFQHIGTMEGIQARVESSSSDQFGAASDGTEIHDRSNVQRLHLQLWVRRIYEVNKRTLFLQLIHYDPFVVLQSVQFLSQHLFTLYRNKRLISAFAMTQRYPTLSETFDSETKVFVTFSFFFFFCLKVVSTMVDSLAQLENSGCDTSWLRGLSHVRRGQGAFTEVLHYQAR